RANVVLQPRRGPGSEWADADTSASVARSAAARTREARPRARSAPRPERRRARARPGRAARGARRARAARIRPRRWADGRARRRHARGARVDGSRAHAPPPRRRAPGDRRGGTALPRRRLAWRAEADAVLASLRHELRGTPDPRLGAARPPLGAAARAALAGVRDARRARPDDGDLDRGATRAGARGPHPHAARPRAAAADDPGARSRGHARRASRARGRPRGRP